VETAYEAEAGGVKRYHTPKWLKPGPLVEHDGSAPSVVLVAAQVEPFCGRPRKIGDALAHRSLAGGGAQGFGLQEVLMKKVPEQLGWKVMRQQLLGLQQAPWAG